MERGLIPDMLSVAAGKLGDPGAGLIGVRAETEDAGSHKAAPQIA